MSSHKVLLAISALSMLSGLVVVSEGFEGHTMPPSGWTHVQTNSNETWEIWNLRPHSGRYYAHVLYDRALGKQDEILLSPSFASESGRVELWSKSQPYWCHYPYDNCDLEVWFVRGDWDGGGGDDVFLGKADDDWLGPWVWSRSVFDFSDHASGDPARVALRYVGLGGAEVAVDDITIDTGEVLLPLILVNCDMAWTEEQFLSCLERMGGGRCE